MIHHSSVWIRRLPAGLVCAASVTLLLHDSRSVTAQGPAVQSPKDPPAAITSAEFDSAIQPLLKQYCLDCHSTASREGELDLERFRTFSDLSRDLPVWQKVREMLDNGEMPPKDAPQPEAAQRALLQRWVRGFVDSAALASAGDPGPVVLRRLNNAEYTYTIQDLTRVPLEPAREFPVDGAAGEGFTNTGQALAMSPALVTKYLDAARDVAGHAVLLPTGIRFSPHTTRNDWTNDALHRIREFYGRFTDNSGGEQVNLQGIVFDTNGGGRLPLHRYLEATLIEREALRSGQQTLHSVAAARQLSPRYLSYLWHVLEDGRSPALRQSGADQSGAAASDTGLSLLLQQLRTRWQQARPEDAAQLAADIGVWQKALWRFTTVGHIGKRNGPTAWQEPVSPLIARQEFRQTLVPPPAAVTAPAATTGTADAGANPEEVTLYLVTTTAGDGAEQDFAVWERPRLVAPGRPDLLLRDVRPVTQLLLQHRQQVFASAAECLAIAAELSTADTVPDVAGLAAARGVSAEALHAWLDYLGIGTAGPVQLGTLLTGRMDSGAGYDFIRGWVGADALSIVANSSDQHVRIPGNMQPHSIAVHPSPSLSVAVGWRSPVAATLQVAGTVQHAHPECGNGVLWSLELRRGNTRQRLAAGVSQGAAVVPVGPLPQIAVQPGDVLSLVISPRDGNHSCDLTAIELTLQDGQRTWQLSQDVAPDILAGNPHADRQGHADVWHFYSEPAGGAGQSGHVIPAGSLLARWQSATTAAERRQLAEQVEQLLQAGPVELPADAPDAALYQQLTSLSGPLLSAALQVIAARSDNHQPAMVRPDKATVDAASAAGLDPASFGRHPADPQAAVEAASLCVQAPSVIEVRLPADLVAGSEFVTSGTLHSPSGREGSLQMQVLTARPDTVTELQPAAVAQSPVSGSWTSGSRSISFASPIIVADDSQARRRLESALDDFRQLFPAALCYTRIVPVDEVVTLTLFYREDDQLRRLMLNDDQIAELNSLWDELHFVSGDALTLVDAYAQLMEYATQDGDPTVFEPLRKPIHDRADAFRQLLADTEPRHVAALLEFAAQAWRRPLTAAETQQLQTLYQQLRQLDLPHEDAIRTLLTRILVAPAFLYRLETPGPGTTAAPVSDWELASRLSYFLWSSPPDAELRELAAAGRLQHSEVLAQQTRRMLSDPKVRRLSTEFACQWLQVYDFDQLDEKSERHFPTFTGIRGALHEEVLQFFTDLFQRNGSVLEVFDADHTFVNAALAEHYGIPGVSGDAWRRVDGVRAYSRGGILAMGATLAKQSGASRTSPILRGNWLSEVVLGEKLPRPPKGVPPLPEDEAEETLTVRQLVERHTSDPKCSGCHLRIDPYGFSLEAFDAIGRLRSEDLGGRPIDTHTRVLDGTEITGLDGLRQYLITQRRDAVLRQFCRKLLGYALGRAVQLSDEPLLKEMHQQLQARGYHVAEAVQSIVLSRQFREIRGRESVTETDLSAVD